MDRALLRFCLHVVRAWVLFVRRWLVFGNAGELYMCVGFALFVEAGRQQRPENPTVVRLSSTIIM